MPLLALLLCTLPADPVSGGTEERNGKPREHLSCACSRGFCRGPLGLRDRTFWHREVALVENLALGAGFLQVTRKVTTTWFFCSLEREPSARSVARSLGDEKLLRLPVSSQDRHCWKDRVCGPENG